MDLNELSARYKAKPASINARLAFLDLQEPVNASELQILDALHEHLDEGKPITTFQYVPEATVEIVKTDGGALQTIQDDQAFTIDFEALNRTYTFLQNAADKGWHLPTSVVKAITGATPKGRYWKRYGFEFTPATRHGSEKAWAVAQATWDWPIDVGR